MITKSRILKIGHADYMGRIFTREAAEQMVKDSNNRLQLTNTNYKVSKLYIEGDYIVAEMNTKGMSSSKQC